MFRVENLLIGNQRTTVYTPLNQVLRQPLHPDYQPHTPYAIRPPTPLPAVKRVNPFSIVPKAAT